VVIDGRLVRRIEVGRGAVGGGAAGGATGATSGNATDGSATAGVATDAGTTGRGAGGATRRGGATIGLVGGTGAAGRLVAGSEGCVYIPTGVAAIVAELTASKGVRILATSEAPRGFRAGEPTGEITITTGAGQEIDVALHGPMAEGVTKARAGGRDGNAVALTPGTVDATPRLPDPVHAPTAGLLVIRGENWTWKPITDAP
jgi:hypothetical protein